MRKKKERNKDYVDSGKIYSTRVCCVMWGRLNYKSYQIFFVVKVERAGSEPRFVPHDASTEGLDAITNQPAVY